MSEGSDIKMVNHMVTSEVQVECPYCGELEDGFLSNPAGGQFTCQSCSKAYKVNPEADIDFR